MNPPICDNDRDFRIGDKAVYPGHGVGIIEAIERKVISGDEQLFYVMRILPPGAQVTRAQIAAAQAWMAYLADHGVSVPRALPTVDGDWAVIGSYDSFTHASQKGSSR